METPFQSDPFLKVRAIQETRSVEDANWLLRKGWWLLRALAKQADGEYVVYVFGWPKDSPPELPFQEMRWPQAS